MKAGQWIDKVKTERGLPSDYAAAKLIGLSRFTVSGYRQRPDATLDEESASKVAIALNVNPAAVLIDQLAERSKNPETRSILQKTAGELYIM